MTQAVPSRYRRGTERSATPEATLERIGPLLGRLGITRCADVTWLDTLGVPVFCAIRPAALVLQVSNGKGLTRADARVSALMESIELQHAERPRPDALRRATRAELLAQGLAPVDPRELTGWLGSPDGERLRVEWIAGEELGSGARAELPSSAVFFHRRPDLHFTTTNGLASGNHLVEATLHGLYELVERDDASALLDQERIPIRERCRVVDLASLRDDDLVWLRERIREAGSRLVLLRVESLARVHSFWAVLLSEDSSVSGSTFNTGWGTHHDLKIAACRAITEAAQSRATLIHGSREDALVKPVLRDAAETRGSRAFGFFRDLPADAGWSELEDLGIGSSGDLGRNLDSLLEDLRAAGKDPVYRCDLTQPSLGVPVVKVLAPKLRFRYR